MGQQQPASSLSPGRRLPARSGHSFTLTLSSADEAQRSLHPNERLVMRRHAHIFGMRNKSFYASGAKMFFEGKITPDSFE